MKFAIGYQLSGKNEESFVDIVRDFKDSIEEVYFPWLDMPSGRAPLTNQRGIIDWNGQRIQEDDLKLFKKMGIRLNLLFNATCYGSYGISQYLANIVCSTVDYLSREVGLDIITTSSLMIAKIVKENFKDIDIRASVNMRIGTVKGMEYVSGLFSSFYIQREYNRDLKRLEELKEWADSNNKKLYLLANSGCLNFCSGQTFHDNLVSHEKEINETLNIDKYNPSICWEYYKDRNNRPAFLQNSWIRPEDMRNYQKYFSSVKLATRMHSNPGKVIKAYVQEKFSGNLLDLLEPGYGPVFSGYIIDNLRFPEDWFDKTTGCDKKCNKCDYCNTVLEKVLLKVA